MKDEQETRDLRKNEADELTAIFASIVRRLRRPSSS